MESTQHMCLAQGLPRWGEEKPPDGGGEDDESGHDDSANQPFGTCTHRPRRCACVVARCRLPHGWVHMCNGVVRAYYPSGICAAYCFLADFARFLFGCKGFDLLSMSTPRSNMVADTSKLQQRMTAPIVDFSMFGAVVTSKRKTFDDTINVNTITGSR